MLRRLRGLFAVALAGAFAAHAPAQDELGLGKMWTFERPPLAYLEREYGFRADEAWWNRMRLASLRFGRGCSASFVSPRGLILTNHHCARDAIAKAQGVHDWVKDGFVARELTDEVPLAGLTVQQLVRTTDVTAEVLAGLRADMDSEAKEAARQANRERLLGAAKQRSPELVPQVVSLFQGAVWQLYEYRVYDDVRLVMAPHLQVAHFGGDPDNFVYPRYAIDFAFCRAYVDGAPADTTATHFVWGDGPDQGELVFLTGNPGGTQRLLTQAQLGYQRDVRYPRVREMIDRRLALLRSFAQDPEREKELRTTILGLENAQKLYRGEHEALRDPAFQRRKAEAEAAFQKRAAAAGHGDALSVWRDLERLMAKKSALDAPLAFHSAGGLPLLLRAEALCRVAAGEAEAGARALAVECRRDAVQEALYADHLARAAQRLPEGDPYVAAALRGHEPSAATEALVRGSRLMDRAEVERLIAAGPDAIRAADDPALVLARAIEPLATANRAAERAVAAEEAALGERIARLLFAVYGDQVSPDATFTLRFSDGRVAGYPYNGTLAPWRTVFHGMFARHAEFGGVHPFDLPADWLAAKDRLDLTAAVDFVCTVDSTGGNSGSPVVDAELRLVGLLFDGNIESMANEFLYGERVERSVCVHPQSIVESLRVVYRAERLLAELVR